MVFVTGDTHADFRRFGVKHFPEQKTMTRDDTVIVTGDFGIWHDTPEERYWLDWLADKPFTIAFVDGNHENFDRLYSNEFPIVDFHEAKAHAIRENILHICRGETMTLEGKTFFCFGGASSHDIDDGIIDPAKFDTPDAFKSAVKAARKTRKRFRILGQSWWPQEMPSQGEMAHGIANLKKRDFHVDYVITHCLPQDAALMLGVHGADPLTMYFNQLIHDGLKFTKWHGGHYHVEQAVFGKFVVHYENIRRIL